MNKNTKKIFFVREYYAYEVYKKRLLRSDNFLSTGSKLEKPKPIYANSETDAKITYESIYGFELERGEEFSMYMPKKYGFVVDRALHTLEKHPNLSYLEHNLPYDQWIEFQKDNGLI